jgi:hypothetical protein
MEEGTVLMLIEGLNWLEKQRRVAGGEVRAAGQRGTCRGSRCRGSPGSWVPWFGSGKTCEGATGVREVRGSPTARDRGGGAEYRWRSAGAIPAIARAGVAGEGLEKLPGTEAELLWGLARVEMQRNCRTMAEQRRLRSELQCAAAARVCGGGGGGGGVGVYG